MRLKDKYFRSLDKISCAQIEKTLVRSSIPRADRYRLGLVLIVEEVFNAPDNNVGIEFATLSIVDDLDVFFAYPWGRVGYSRLIKGFQGRYASKFRYAKRKREKEISYTVHGFPIAMQIWAFEAIPEIGQSFGQRLGERSLRILSWKATKQTKHRTYDALFKKVQLHVFTTLRPTEMEQNQHYMATLMPFDDIVVPILDDIANTVVDAQFDAVADVGGGDGQDLSKQEDDGDSISGGSDDIGSGTGDRAVQSTEQNDNSSSDNVRDSDDGESHADRAQGGMTGVQMGGGLTRSDIKDMLDLRVLFEMRLQTVKLEICEHVTAEHARLRDFISTVVAPVVTIAAAVPNDVRNDPVHSPQPYGGYEHEFGLDMNQMSEEHDSAFCGGEPELNVARALIVGGTSGQVESEQDLHGNQSDEARIASGAMEAGIASGAMEVEGGPTEDPVQPTSGPIRRRRSTRIRMPAASTRNPYTRGKR